MPSWPTGPAGSVPWVIGRRRPGPAGRLPAGPAALTRPGCASRSERRVAVRPAPDTMAYLTALLPVGPGVAGYAALTRHADTLRGGR